MVKDRNTRNAAAAHGKKYGCHWKKAVWPNVSGHRSAGWLRTLPMVDLIKDLDWKALLINGQQWTLLWRLYSTWLDCMHMHLRCWICQLSAEFYQNLACKNHWNGWTSAIMVLDMPGKRYQECHNIERYMTHLYCHWSFPVDIRKGQAARKLWITQRITWRLTGLAAQSKGQVYDCTSLIGISTEQWSSIPPGRKQIPNEFSLRKTIQCTDSLWLMIAPA